MSKQVTVPGPVYRTAREIQCPNFITNNRVIEEPNIINLRFRDPNQFAELAPDHPDLELTAREIRPVTTPATIRHFHLANNQNQRPTYVVHCSKLVTSSESIPQCQPQMSSNTDPSSASQPSLLTVRSYNLSNGKTHFIFDIKERIENNREKRAISLAVPVIHKVVTEPTTVNWCVEEEPYPIPDPSRVNYRDTFYWYPKVMYDARRDHKWQSLPQSFDELHDKSTIPSTAVPAFTLEHSSITEQMPFAPIKSFREPGSLMKKSRSFSALTGSAGSLRFTG